MKFDKWVDKKRKKESRTAFLREFSKECGVSLQTLQFVVKGGRVSFYHKAKAISEGTKGAVRVVELCE